jgi:hypothetical protein
MKVIEAGLGATRSFLRFRCTCKVPSQGPSQISVRFFLFLNPITISFLLVVEICRWFLHAHEN